MRNTTTRKKQSRTATAYQVVLAPKRPSAKSRKLFRADFTSVFEKMVKDKVNPQQYMYAHFVWQCIQDVANNTQQKYLHPIGCYLEYREAVFTTTYFFENSDGKYQYEYCFGNEDDNEKRRTITSRALSLLMKYGLIVSKREFKVKGRIKPFYIYKLCPLSSRYEPIEFTPFDDEASQQKKQAIENIKQIEFITDTIKMKDKEFRNSRGSIDFGKFSKAVCGRFNSINGILNEQRKKIASQDSRLRKLESAEQENAKMRQKVDKMTKLLKALGVEFELVEF